MGAVWLHDLPDVCRNAGLVTHTYPGWETRSRGSGGYNAVYAIGAHHTASDTSPESDMNYMWGSHNPNEPVGAIYLARSGEVTIGCAGATNTQGKGVAWTNSKGQRTPDDDANRYWISIEAANAGTGQAWPTVQQDAYVTLCAALCDAYGLSDYDVRSHFEWSPGRKIDPAGNSRYATGGNLWNMDQFRADVRAAMGGGTVPPPTNPGDGVFANMSTVRMRWIDSRPSQGGGGAAQADQTQVIELPASLGNPAEVFLSIQTFDGTLEGAYGRVYTSPDADAGTSEFTIRGDGTAARSTVLTRVGSDRKLIFYFSAATHWIVDVQGVG